MTFDQRATAFPPCLVRLLARTAHGKQPMDFMQICNRSTALTPILVDSLSQETSWKNVHYGLLRDFTVACDVDFCDWNRMKLIDAYIRSKPRFEYLIRHGDWPSYYLPLLKRYRESYGDMTNQHLDLWPPVRALLVRLTPLIKPHHK